MVREFDMDRRAYLKTVGAAGTATALAGCSGGGGESSVIVPGTSAGFPPFEYIEGGELVGFDVSLAEEVVTEAGQDLGEWSDISFESLIPSLVDGQIDLIAAGMTITEDRQETIAFTDPYWESNQSVLVQEGGDFQPGSVADLGEASVGAQAGTTGEGEVEGLVEEGTISGDAVRRYDNYTLAVQDLENGNVDAIIIDQPVAENFSSDRAVSVAFVIETGEEFGMGVRQDYERLSDLNDAIATVKENGSYDDLVTEWFE